MGMRIAMGMSMSVLMAMVARCPVFMDTIIAYREGRDPARTLTRYRRPANCPIVMIDCLND